MPQIELIESADFFIEKEEYRGPMHAMHHHRSFELYFLCKGEREYFIDDRFFKLTEGDMVLVPRAMLHRTAGKGATRFLLHFSESFLLRFFTREALTPLLSRRPFVFRADESGREHLSRILHTLLMEYNRAEREGTPQNDAMLAGYLYQLLFTMTFATNTYVPHDYADGRVTQVIKYINENYNQITDIEEIAAHFYISKYHLCRVFRQATGLTVHQYIRRKRITLVKELATEGKNLTEAALLAGFNDYSAFYRAYKGEFKTAPKKDF